MIQMFLLDVPSGDVELFGLRLWDHGVQGIEEISSIGGTTRLRSTFGLDRERTEELLNRSFADCVWSIQEVEESVTDSWKRFARPVRIDDQLSVVPAWIDKVPPSIPDEAAVPPMIRIRIEPGSTFGLGDHPTTQSCLRLVKRYVRTGGTVLDIGCGSGVLGISAIRLGARSAHGVDINPAAKSVSLANASSNGVQDGWSVHIGSPEMEDVEYDLVLANILAPTLIELRNVLRESTREDGVLIISGLLVDGYDHVINCLDGFHEIDRIEMDGWITLALRRRVDHDTRESISSR